MSILSQILAVIAELLLKSEWENLRKKLLLQYVCHQHEKAYLPPLLTLQLLISGEDHRYLRHPGFDWIAICRAVWRRFAWGVTEGASTIEQQIVRVLTGRYERTFRRKLREILLAVLVARTIPKPELPGIYLEIAYFGWRMNGFRQACQRLKLNPMTISLEDAASLVARLKYPEPRVLPKMRLSQIEIRTRHLIMLHKLHLENGVYGYARHNFYKALQDNRCAM
jgi:membrane peptidoglycan carboxypeptidase